MFKTFSFNIFRKNLQDVVYKNSKKQKTENNAFPIVLDKPIPKPAPDFWRPAFISKFINYKPKGAR